MIGSLRIVNFFVAVAKRNVLFAVWDTSIWESIVPDRTIAWFSRKRIILYLLKSLFFIFQISLTFYIFFHILNDFSEGPEILFFHRVDNPTVLKYRKKISNHLFFITSLFFYRIISKIFTDPNLNDPKFRPSNHPLSNPKQTESASEVLNSPDNIYYFRNQLFVNFCVAHPMRDVFEK